MATRSALFLALLSTLFCSTSSFSPSPRAVQSRLYSTQLSSFLDKWHIEECDGESDDCDVGQMDVRALGYSSGIGGWLFKKNKAPESVEEAAEVTQVAQDSTDPYGLGAAPEPLIMSAGLQSAVSQGLVGDSSRAPAAKKERKQASAVIAMAGEAGTRSR